MKNNLNKIGRYLSLLLRHNPEKENLNIDNEGYVQVNELISKLDISINDLNWIVNNNNKKRFVFNNDMSKIRAAQGHSIPVKLNMKKILPPEILYHGTTIDNKNKINKGGLMKMNRNHVHLSDNIDTASDVGMRYAKYQNKLWLIKIDAKKMNNDGLEFFISENNVYLTNHVPSKYFIK